MHGYISPDLPNPRGFKWKRFSGGRFALAGRDGMTVTLSEDKPAFAFFADHVLDISDSGTSLAMHMASNTCMPSNRGRTHYSSTRHGPHQLQP